jgi:hypothetical protein
MCAVQQVEARDRQMKTKMTLTKYVDLINFNINMWLMNVICVFPLLCLEVRTLKRVVVC